MPGPGRERETHAEGATKASQEGAEGHDAVAEFIAKGILDLPRTGGADVELISQSSETVTTMVVPSQSPVMFFLFISL